MFQVAVKNTAISRMGVVFSRSVKKETHLGIGLWTLLITILFVTMLCVWSRAQVVRLGYEISDQTKTLLELKRENEKLKASVARLKAPGRLEPIARKKLLLLPPKNKQIIVLK